MTNWPKFKLGEICSFITDGSHNPPKGIENSQYLMLSSRDINQGKLTFDKPRFLSAEDFEIENKRTNLQSGDVLLTTVGTIGRTAIYSGVPKYVTFQRSVSVLRPKVGVIIPKFLMYYLDSITDYLNLESRGVAQQGIYLNQVRMLEVPVPPLWEQQNIVEFLEDYFLRLDAALADVKQAKVKAAQLRRSLLQAAFTGNLGSDGTSLMGELPTGWRVVPLGKFLEPRRQKDIPANFPSLPYIGMENVLRDVGVIDSYGISADYRSLAPKVFPGDVLYGRLRPYLNKVVITKAEAFASGEFIVLPPNEFILGRFLQLRLLSQDFVQFTATLDTGDRPRVSWDQISKFEILLPPLPEQLKIVEILEDLLSRLDASLALADTMEKQSAGLRRSFLQAAFTGQLTKEVASV